MAQVKLFSYNPTLPTHRDWVRWMLGDTDQDRAETDDQELDALLADEPEPEPEFEDEEPTAAQWRSYRATVAARAAESIAARYAREADVSFDNQRTSLSAKFIQYRQLAQQLRATAQGSAGLKTQRV